VTSIADEVMCVSDGLIDCAPATIHRNPFWWDGEAGRQDKACHDIGEVLFACSPRGADESTCKTSTRSGSN
jgi:hypothetical protein